MLNDNLEGHRARLATLMERMPVDQALATYVGAGRDYRHSRLTVGWFEREILAHVRAFDGVAIIDIGCGIGRLVRYLTDQPVKSYLGTDILPEVLEEAKAVVAGDDRFRFTLVDRISIPADANSADMVCAFSVMTHLLDEEVFAYFNETARVLSAGGNAVFSFFDYGFPRHQAMFLGHTETHGKRHDVLKWFEKSTLAFFAKSVGLEIVEFIDPDQRFPTKFHQTPMLDGNPPPRDWSPTAQSVLVLTKP